MENSPGILVEIIKTENFKKQAAATAIKATRAKRKRCTQIAGVVVGDTLAANEPPKSAIELDEEVGRVLGRTLGHGKLDDDLDPTNLDAPDMISN